jgi:hypothetical protein
MSVCVWVYVCKCVCVWVVEWMSGCYDFATLHNTYHRLTWSSSLCSPLSPVKPLPTLLRGRCLCVYECVCVCVCVDANVIQHTLSLQFTDTHTNVPHIYIYIYTLTYTPDATLSSSCFAIRAWDSSCNRLASVCIYICVVYVRCVYICVVFMYMCVCCVYVCACDGVVSITGQPAILFSQHTHTYMLSYLLIHTLNNHLYTTHTHRHNCRKQSHTQAHTHMTMYLLTQTFSIILTHRHSQ